MEGHKRLWAVLAVFASLQGCRALMVSSIWWGAAAVPQALGSSPASIRAPRAPQPRPLPSTREAAECSDGAGGQGGADAVPASAGGPANGSGHPQAGAPGRPPHPAPSLQAPRARFVSSRSRGAAPAWRPARPALTPPRAAAAAASTAAEGGAQRGGDAGSHERQLGGPRDADAPRWLERHRGDLPTTLCLHPQPLAAAGGVRPGLLPFRREPRACRLPAAGGGAGQAGPAQARPTA